jgi:hypothetical protein
MLCGWPRHRVSPARPGRAVEGSEINPHLPVTTYSCPGLASHRQNVRRSCSTRVSMGHFEKMSELRGRVTGSDHRISVSVFRGAMAWNGMEWNSTSECRGARRGDLVIACDER